MCLTFPLKPQPTQDVHIEHNREHDYPYHEPRLIRDAVNRETQISFIMG